MADTVIKDILCNWGLLFIKLSVSEKSQLILIYWVNCKIWLQLWKLLSFFGSDWALFIYYQSQFNTQRDCLPGVNKYSSIICWKKLSIVCKDTIGNY